MTYTRYIMRPDLLIANRMEGMGIRLEMIEKSEILHCEAMSRRWDINASLFWTGSVAL